MKKLLSLLLVLCLFAGIATTSASAVGPVDITSAFTDPNFLAAVRKAVGGGPLIYDTAVAKITKLNVWASKIQSAAGLEYFVNLEEFDCSSNQLTSLPELPPSLRRLDCHSNQLTSLPALPPGLTWLVCQANQLTELPELPSTLTTLSCSWNQLTSLPALPPGVGGWFDCSYNQITGIDATALSSLTYLNYFNCSYNDMEDISALIGYTSEWDNNSGFRFYPQANKAELNRLITQAKAMRRNYYYGLRRYQLRAPIKQAQAVVDDSNATRERIIEVIDALRDDMRRLTLRQPGPLNYYNYIVTDLLGLYGYNQLLALPLAPFFLLLELLLYPLTLLLRWLVGLSA